MLTLHEHEFLRQPSNEHSEPVWFQLEQCFAEKMIKNRQQLC